MTIELNIPKRRIMGLLAQPPKKRILRMTKVKMGGFPRFWVSESRLFETLRLHVSIDVSLLRSHKALKILEHHSSWVDELKSSSVLVFSANFVNYVGE